MTAFIGLTGGIASGKSTVAARFRELGVTVVDADALAREVVAKGTDGLAEIVKAFGADVLDADGALDRKKLGAIVFDDDDARRTLERITHPRIAALSMQRMAAVAASGAPYGLYEAALLVEKGTHRTMNGLVVVAVSPEVQLARVMSRDGLDEASARARLAAQMPLEDKLAAATWTIWNDADLATLRARVDEVHRAILASLATSV
ncbi:MAG: dephospho-CoA kinase [Deltaproteobacteria bacterium]|nr:dephospho-CoA kinase [Deltaproteobacteria bacterium]